METLVQIEVMVPQARVGEFYEMLGRWLQGPPRSSPVLDLPAASPSIAVAPERRSWTEGSREELLRDAEIVSRNLSLGAKRILDHLLDQPNNEALATSLAEDLGLASANGVAGTLASFGFQC